MSTSSTNSTPAELFAQRLRQAMRDAGLQDKPSALQAQFNAHADGQPISWQTARNWLQGGFLPQPAKLQTLASALKINPEYLLFDAPAGDEAVSVSDRSMWDSYLKIDPDLRPAIREMVEQMLMMQRADLERHIHTRLAELEDRCEAVVKAASTFDDLKELRRLRDDTLQEIEDWQRKIEELRTLFTNKTENILKVAELQITLKNSIDKIPVADGKPQSGRRSGSMPRI